MSLALIDGNNSKMAHTNEIFAAVVDYGNSRLDLAKRLRYGWRQITKRIVSHQKCHLPFYFSLPDVFKRILCINLWYQVRDVVL